jgi:hypothetical protein
MKALISPNENNRICQVEAQDFPVADPLFWADCPDDCTTAWVYVDGSFVEPSAPPAPTPQEQFAAIQAQIQTRLDTFAQTRGYDGILSATTYATSTVERFAKDGQYCVEARDLTWAAAVQIQSDVEEGKRPMPTYEEVEAELPVLAWPA